MFIARGELFHLSTHDGRTEKLSRRVKSFPVSPLVGLVVYKHASAALLSGLSPLRGRRGRRQKGSDVTLMMMMGDDGFSESDAGNHAASSSELFCPCSLSLGKNKIKKLRQPDEFQISGPRVSLPFLECDQDFG